MKCYYLIGCIFILYSCETKSTIEKFDAKGYQTESIGQGAELISYESSSGWNLSKGALINGGKSGTWLTYHDNSNKIKTLTSFINGRKNGVELIFNDRGQLTSMAEYKNDQLHGLKATYSFGRPLEETSYKNGKIDGSFSTYGTNGKLQKKGELKNGKYHGKLQYFNDEGKVTLEYEYKNGEKVGGGIVPNQEESTENN